MNNLYLENISFFKLGLASLMFTVLSALINVIFYTTNKLTIINTQKVIRNVLKLLTVYILFKVDEISLLSLGKSMVITEILVFLYVIYRIRGIRGAINFKIRIYRVWPVLAMAVWTIIHQLGYITSSRIDIMTAGFIDVENLAAILSPFAEMSSYVFILIASLSMLFGPIILQFYNRSLHDKILAILSTTSFNLGLIAALLCGFIAGSSNLIINIWLSEEYLNYSHLLAYKLLPIPALVMSGLSSLVFRAWNNVRLPAVLSLINGLVSLASILLVIKINPRLNVETLLIISSLFQILGSYGINTWVVQRIYPSKRVLPIKEFLLVYIIFFITYTVTYLIILFFLQLQLFSAILVSTLLVIIVSYIMVRCFSRGMISLFNLIFAK